MPIPVAIFYAELADVIDVPILTCVFKAHIRCLVGYGKLACVWSETLVDLHIGEWRMRFQQEEAALPVKQEDIVVESQANKISAGRRPGDIRAAMLLPQLAVIQTP